MRSLSLQLSLLVALCGCGAKSGLDLGDGMDSGTADSIPPLRDAGTPSSCRSAPNCIEADIITPTGEVIPFAREGEVTVATHMGRGAWLETPAVGDLSMAVQVSLDAVPGPVELSLNRAAFYVDLRFPEAHCNIRGAGYLEVVDLSTAGVTEGTFEGRTRDHCADGANEVREGWFRLTAP